MVRLRIALGVASSLVAVAALTIVFSGTGQAQGNGNGPNVFVTNTPLPVTGTVAATISGNLSATIINPSNSPVLIRDVDAPGAKELWQENKSVLISPSFPDVHIDFAQVPAGKALVIEHVNIRVSDAGPDAPELDLLWLSNQFSFGASPIADTHSLVAQAQGHQAIADAATKFYVAPGDIPRVYVERKDLGVPASVWALLTGYLVNYP